MRPLLKKAGTKIKKGWKDPENGSSIKNFQFKLYQNLDNRKKLSKNRLIRDALKLNKTILILRSTFPPKNIPMDHEIKNLHIRKLCGNWSQLKNVSFDFL